MTMTTIKVPVELRNRINSNAHQQGYTAARYVEHLVDSEERRIRMENLGAAIRANPPDDEYWREFAELDLIGGGILDV